MRSESDLSLISHGSVSEGFRLSTTIGMVSNFISFSQLAATLTIAKINKKVVYEAFFDWLKRKQKSFKQGA